MNRYIYGFETGLEHIIYSVSFTKDTDSYYASFKKGLSPQEIINIDTNKFDLITNKLIIIKENELGFFSYQTSNNYSNLYLNIIKKDIDQNNDASSLRFIYLTQRNFDYNLYFSSNSKNFYIRLVNETLDAEIEILDEKNEIINKENRYAFFDKNVTKISLRLKNNNSALIEIAYEYNIGDDNKLGINETDYDLKAGIYSIICKKSDNISSIKITVKSDEKISGLIFPNIGKKNYISPHPNRNSANHNLLESNIIIPNKYIDDNEEFIIYLSIDKNFTLKLETEPDTDINIDDHPNENSGHNFPAYAIALICIGGSIFIILVLFLVFHAIRRKKMENLDTISFSKKIEA